MASVFLTRLRKTLSLTLRLTWSRRRTLVAGCVGGRRDVGGLSRALADSNCPTKLQLFITRPPPLLPRQFCPQALHFQRQRPGGLSADARMLRPRTCKQYKISLVPIHFRCCPTRDRFTGPVQDLHEEGNPEISPDMNFGLLPTFYRSYFVSDTVFMSFEPKK